MGARLERRPLLARRDPRLPLGRRLLPPSWSVRLRRSRGLVPSALYTGFVMTEGAAYAACHARVPRDHPLSRAPDESARSSARSSHSASRPACGSSSRRSAPRSSPPSPFAGSLTHGWGSRPRRPPASLASGLSPRRGSGRARRARCARQPARGLRRPLALVRPRRGRALDAGAGSPDSASTSRSCRSWRSRGWSRALARGEGRRRPAAAFVSLFVSVNAVLLLVVGAFASTEFGIGFLHDRYLFYVVPLWIVATAVWAERRVAGRPPGPRRRRAPRPGAARDAPDLPPQRGRGTPLRRDRRGSSVRDCRVPPGAPSPPLVAARCRP